MARYKLLLEYAGTRFRGWQIQPNARTVQGEVERAIVRALDPPGGVELYGSGRTDAGVHALGQVAHLDLRAALPPARILDQVNRVLPFDINLLAVERVSHRFHARHSASARRYVYQVSRRRTAFGKPFVWWVSDALDLSAMAAAVQVFVGLHDFRSFSADTAENTSTKVLVERAGLFEDGALVLIWFEASHFLWKMVRRLVGGVVAAGRHGWPPHQLGRHLVQHTPEPARWTAPAAGLFLERVFYPGDPRHATPARGPLVVTPTPPGSAGGNTSDV